jgi:hypothetical protein
MTCANRHSDDDLNDAPAREARVTPAAEAGFSRREVMHLKHLARLGD